MTNTGQWIIIYYQGKAPPASGGEEVGKMLHLADSAAMRGADDKAIHVTGIPSTLLMTNAAGHLARAAEDVMGTNRRAVIFCGSGASITGSSM